MENASTILLLGFGYLDQNVQLLMLGEKRNASRFISSAYGVSQSDQAIILAVMGSFARPTGPDIMLEPGTCSATAAESQDVQSSWAATGSKMLLQPDDRMRRMDALPAA
ncbi:MAG TPA: hypothetical protein VF404_03450 [Sphingomonas sp.]